MKLSELQSALTKVASIVGDVDVVLKDAVSEAETVITDLGIHLDPATGAAGTSVTMTHDAAPPPPVAEPAPADPEPQS